MSNKKELSSIADASAPKRSASEQADFNIFCLGFETDDVQMSYFKNGKVKVTANIDKSEFDKIIYTNASYIIDYLKEKKFI